MAESAIRRTTTDQRESASLVEVIVADHQDQEQATLTITVSLTMAGSGYPRLIEVQKVALQHAQNAIGAAIQRIARILVDRIKRMVPVRLADLRDFHRFGRSLLYDFHH